MKKIFAGMQEDTYFNLLFATVVAAAGAVIIGYIVAVNYDTMVTMWDTPQRINYKVWGRDYVYGRDNLVNVFLGGLIATAMTTWSIASLAAAIAKLFRRS